MTSTEHDAAPDAIAAICLTADIVTDDHCEVVLGAVVTGYAYDHEAGKDVPQYLMGDEMEMAPGVTLVQLPSLAAGNRDNVVREATDVLREHGWYVRGEWESTDNAMYAEVVRD